MIDGSRFIPRPMNEPEGVQPILSGQRSQQDREADGQELERLVKIQVDKEQKAKAEAEAIELQKCEDMLVASKRDRLKDIE